MVGGFGALGTSLSLPLKIQADKRKKALALKQMADKGWIKCPKDAAQKEKYIQSMLLQDTMAGTGNAASLKAFSLVPLLSGGLLALEGLGLPRKWVKSSTCRFRQEQKMYYRWD